MEAIVIESSGEAIPARLVELADEMAEDPRCHLVLIGYDAAGTMLFTLWDDEVADEVAEQVRRSGDWPSARRLAVPEGTAVWS